MTPSANTHKEIKSCEILVAQLASSTTAPEFERTWLQVLGSLKRIWNKCETHYKSSPKWHGWYSKSSITLKQDPLLQYLDQARHVHEHLTDEVTKIEYGGIGFSAGSGKPLHIKHLEITASGIAGEWSGNLQVTFMPDRVRPIAVKHRGRTYEVPNTHLGQNIASIDVLTFARLGLKFYRQLVCDADDFFSDKPKSHV